MPAKSSPPAMESAVPQISAVVEISSRSLQLMSAASEDLSENMRKTVQLVSEFTSQRLKKDLEMARKLAECQTPDQVWKVQCAFFEDTVADYAKEAVALIELASATTLVAAQPVEKAGEGALQSLTEATAKLREAEPKAPREAVQAAAS